MKCKICATLFSIAAYFTILPLFAAESQVQQKKGLLRKENTNKEKAPVEIDKSNWIKLRNKYGWELRLPACWETFGIEDAGSSDSPNVTLLPGKTCPTTISRNQEIKIITPLLIAPTSPELRLRHPLWYKKQRGIETLTLEIPLGAKTAKGYIHLSPIEKGKDLQRLIIWGLEDNCDNRNLHLGIFAELPAASKDLPLKKLDFPPVMKEILSTFVCYRP